MAKFCEVLAENVRASSAGRGAAQWHVVAKACDQASMGISGAYPPHRRNPSSTPASRAGARARAL